MTTSEIEQKIRRYLPVVRFAQAYIPTGLSNRIIASSTRRVQLPEDIEHKTIRVADVPCVWLVPQNSPTDQALLYLHGGAFMFGLSSLHIEMLAHLANAMNSRVLAVDYRLAPKYSYPAALDDCIAVYRWLLAEGFAAEEIAIAGDSAGGNLTLTSLLRLRDSGDPLPAAAACLSPVADLTGAGRQMPIDHDPLLHPRMMRKANRSYIGQDDARNPLISPIFGDWHGLPPLLIHAGEDEILRDDAIRCEKKAKEAGVDVRLEIYPHMWHVWQLFPELPEAERSLADIGQFLKSHLDPTHHRASNLETIGP
jgi:acetyl esterase/lipase